LKDASSVSTFKACLGAIEEFNPHCFILENVDLGDGEDPDSNLAIINEALQKCGYTVKVFKLTANDFGVPQRRLRIFICGFHSEKQPQASWVRVERMLNLMRLKSQPPEA